MNLPKIKFREMTLKENIDIIKWAYYEDDGTLSIHDYTIKYFPELANINKDEPQNEIYKKIEEIVTREYKKNSEIIKNETKRYNEIWKDYNEKYLSLLSKYLEVEWPKIDIIEASVGLIPVFPRYLDSFSFSVGTGLEDYSLIEASAHETLHFMWFEKWKKIHPETPRREYDSPYITWQYSEMVTDPILNNKPFSDLFTFIEHGYDSFYKLKDGDNLVMDNLRNIYASEKNIEEKMNDGFDYIQSLLNQNRKRK